MKKVISFVNAKSSGKSTIIRALASALIEGTDKSVEIIDTDTDKPDMLVWQMRREKNNDVQFKNIKVTAADTTAEAAKFAKASNADFVLIDSEGSLNVLRQQKLIDVSDYFIISTVMDSDTCSAAIRTHLVLEEDKLPHKCVYIWDATSPKWSKEKVQFLKENKVPLFKNNLRTLTAYKMQADTGLSLLELEDSRKGIFTKSAHTEIRDFTKELIEELK